MTGDEEETRRVKAWNREKERKFGRSWPMGADDAERSRMTIRVSRDSGRTYGPVIVVSPRKDVPPQNDSSRLPDCTCPRCVAP
ncbi:hypothetical protein [Streptomyces iconiensis]|uniref:Uncharacterized protein n=1 Tax=Streptomyces iconiensis TaxID=1384038 RepID=A0ABT6ZNQ1_9ACTN|nr:hypothetical protein [Streptomyces iconiensis]MDJ1130671.1 hypothetical protein [Streptomyces iconiensis]